MFPLKLSVMPQCKSKVFSKIGTWQPSSPVPVSTHSALHPLGSDSPAPTSARHGSGSRTTVPGSEPAPTPAPGRSPAPPG